MAGCSDDHTITDKYGDAYAAGMYRDVTEMLAVDASDPACSTADDAVRAIKGGNRTVVAEDATAVNVLERLGLPRSRAIFQVRSSYGPMRDPADECLQHLAALMPTGWHRYRDEDGTIKVVARWFWPHSTRVEGNDGSGWVERSWFPEVQEDADWENTSEDEVNAWIAARPRNEISESSDVPSAPSGAVIGIPEDWSDLSDAAKDAAVETMLIDIGAAFGLVPESEVDDAS